MSGNTTVPDMELRRLKVLLLHNIVAPYRLPIFEEINKSVDLDVYFFQESAKGRSWDTSIGADYSFYHKILPSVTLGRLVVNPTIFRELSDKKYDVIIVNENPANAISIASIALLFHLRGVPVIFWSEHVDTDYSRESRGIWFPLIQGLYLRWLHSLGDFFVALSKMAAKFLSDRKILGAKIVTGTQSMPAECITPGADSGARIPLGTMKLVLYVGHLARKKGVDVLIKAFRGLTDPRIALILAGEGNEGKYMRDIADDDNRIHFVGYISGETKRAYFEHASILVLPTLHDAWGLVVNEAAHFRVPVITTTAAGSSEIVGDNGIVVPPGDELALRNAIQRILNDDRLAKKMRDASELVSKRLDTKQGAKPFLDAITLAANKKGRMRLGLETTGSGVKSAIV